MKDTACEKIGRSDKAFVLLQKVRKRADNFYRVTEIAAVRFKRDYREVRQVWHCLLLTWIPKLPCCQGVMPILPDMELPKTN